jgi:hypothetical protein
LQTGSSDCSRSPIKFDAEQWPRQFARNSARLVDGAGRIDTFTERASKLGKINESDETVSIEITGPACFAEEIDK